MAKDDEFLRKFAAEIAAALREKEDGQRQDQRQNQPSVDESVEELYRALVFDEPLVDRIPNLPVVASALSRQLSTPTSSYAISNRLVNGILYLCNQHATTSAQQKTKAAEAEKDKNSDTNNLNRDNTTSYSTIQVAMAKLAFCILLEIPLQCCRENSSSSSHLKKIRHLLGTYKGTNRSSIARNDHQTEFATMGTENNPSKTQEEEKVDATKAEAHPSEETQQIETEEVWAAESDPSDFDYGDSIDTINEDTWQQAESDIDWLDPKVLSRQDPDMTPQQIRDAIGSLLQHASYTLLEPIFCLPQKETAQFTSKLTHLVLVLLQPRKESTNADSGIDDSLLGSSMDDAILSPLWILRDAAIYHGKNTARKAAPSNYEQSYLQVLQNLLAMDQAHLQDVGKLVTSQKEKPDLCVSSIVGLSSLSSWCASQSKPTSVTIEAIVDCMNDLEHIIERGQKHYKSNLPNTLIPILETLSGIHYDRLNNKNVTTAHCYKGSTIPQTFLNSGLLRQILALVASVNDENSHDKSSALGFHHALWGLCIAYPKIIGKYVFRHPGSSQIIRLYATYLDTSTPQNCVQCILWNVYGWYQCKESGGGGLSSLRKPGSVTPRKLTQDECSEVCQKAWTRLCNLVKEAIVGSETNTDASCERVIEEWGRLLVLASGTHIADDFKVLVDSSLLGDIASVIANQSSHNNETTESSNNDGKEDDDKPSRKQKTVSQAHKLLKKYKLFFQGTTSGSSKTD